MKIRERPYERVAEGLRKRISAGEWQPGEMIPARRILALEYGVAVATLERAAGALIGEGLLLASDRRGTFVAHLRDKVSHDKAELAPISGGTRAPLQATVGIVASIIHYDKPELRREQWAGKILAAVEHGLSAEQGLTQRFMNLVQPGEKDLLTSRAVEQLLSHGVNAVVVIGDVDQEGAISLCEKAGVPLVSLEYDPVPFLVPQVYLDNAAGGMLAARHLRDRGYSHLTFLRPFSAVWAEARLSGARAVMGQDDLRVFPAEIRQEVPGTGDDQRKYGYDLGCSLLNTDFKPGTGVIAPNDSVAMGFMRAATEKGLVPGKDYGIVGFDDFNREAHLTSLRPPLDQMGEEGARLVVRLLRGESSATRIALQHRLIARSSTSQGI